ncbi:Ribonuclease HII [Candidatus Rhodobacter oscarellae]|uniref:Ribonuclease HII n=1 Tax=Candidatus Rhodobacter oscarellae TaxID=1675527 RepID=A0A0J9E8R5_9RHOB|nr:ribonuclease HII [Candidatus Rhodobacter lobularis]KMW59165.1 Ribonuclease HII [Candidatus Rhodobacter lobularis]
MKRPAPTLEFEQAAHQRGFTRVCGVDEVGRGPLAGPVTAAAVVLDPDNIPPGLADSKTLTAQRRVALAEDIHANAQVSIAHATAAEIDEINILQASLLAMRRAISSLEAPADFALVDGNRLPVGMNIQGLPVVKGDARVLSIAAASIVAKVCRDEIMESLAQQFPGYGWERNAGYPTQEHRDALKNLGATPHHRRSFKPVHNIL